jgi:hypothetical protein
MMVILTGAALLLAVLLLPAIVKWLVEREPPQ